MCSEFEKDIPFHRKKKESSTSKSKVKSKHKHEYKDCLLIENETGKPHKGSYCRLCGKIDKLCFTETEKIEQNGRFVYRALSAEETFEKYKNLERVSIESIWQKYVPISKNC